MSTRRHRRTRYEGEGGAVTRWAALVEQQRLAEEQRLAAEQAAAERAVAEEARLAAESGAPARIAGTADTKATADPATLTGAPAPAPATAPSSQPTVDSDTEFSADALPEPIAVSPLGEPAEAFALSIPVEAGGGAATVSVEIGGAPAAPVEPVRRRRHRVLATAVMVVVAAAAFLTGMFVCNNWLMPQLIHGGGQVRVPDLANLTLDQAEQALRPVGLQLSRAGERFDPAVPRGFVLSQEPDAGTEVRGRKRISVVMSLGEEYSSVPELFGESPRGARLLIERAGLRVGGVTHAPSEDMGQGLVVSSDPGPETVLMRDTPVHLLVSTGPGEESYVMPELLGHEVGAVRRQLEALGFHVALAPGSPALGTIVAQSPAAGARINPATEIALQTAARGAR
jgi:beta-lactam-binding protein with PASTA domain